MSTEFLLMLGLAIIIFALDVVLWVIISAKVGSLINRVSLLEDRIHDHPTYREDK